MKTPWDYQLAGADALWNQVHTAPSENPLVVMPTGTGKSLTMAVWTWGMLTRYPHLRMLNLTHVKELVNNNFNALKELWPTAPAGVFSAGLKRKDYHGQVTFAGIESIQRSIKRFGRIDFVLVDEAHRIGDNEKSTYQRVFAALREVNPNLVVIGFTATAFRMGMGLLTDGELFDRVCFDLSDGRAFVWMLDNNYLLRLLPKNPGFQVDESRVKIKAGEYDEKSASEAFRDQDILDRAVQSIIQHGEEEGRQAWLTFAQSIDDCELVADMFRHYGYPVVAVHSKLKEGERDEALEAFRLGKLRGLVNKDVLTTGYDNPRVDLIGVLRLIRSPGLWVQLLGRGTRPLWTPGYPLATVEQRRHSILASAKQDCRVLDFAGNTMRLGPINYPTIPKQRRKGGGGEPPVRECPKCGTYTHISVKVCDECGYEFPPPQKLQANAGNEDLVVDLNHLPPPTPKEFGVFKVSQMIAAVHPGKNGKPATMRVDYFCGVRRFSTWVCFGHYGYARTSAEWWWRDHSKCGLGLATDCPDSAADGVARFVECGKPQYLKVWVNTKYPEIEAYDFAGYAFELPPELGGPPKAADQDTPEERAEQEETARLVKVFGDDDIPF